MRLFATVANSVKLHLGDERTNGQTDKETCHYPSVRCVCQEHPSFFMGGRCFI